MKRKFTVYAASEDAPSHEEILRDTIDSVSDNIEYAMAGIEHLVDSGRLESAETLLNELRDAVDSIVREIGAEISGEE